MAGADSLHLSRRNFLALSAATLAAPRLLSAQQGASKPNIIVIVIDDLGYADLGCQGSTEVLTPHIDSLAKNGVRFTDGYVASPICAPARATMMTGRYAQRFGMEFNPPSGLDVHKLPPNACVGLPLDERTLPELLKPAGYATGCIGKWHLGHTPPYHPMKRGFDEFFGFLGGSHSYLHSNYNKSDPVMRGTRQYDEKDYSTDAYTREAVDFIGRHAKEPFFLYLAYNAVHGPMDEPPARYMERFPKVEDQLRRIFCGMLAAVDDGVGAILSKLRDLKLEEDTLIFFISDNGGHTNVNTSRNEPLAGLKGTTREGGVRVPFIIQWKGHLPPAEYGRPVVSMDIFNTSLSAAGLAVPKEPVNDGVDLLPYLTGKNDSTPHETLCFRYNQWSGIRHGKWKLLKWRDKPVQLFDLDRDISEKRDLAPQQPEKVKELTALWEAWNAQMKKPMWLINPQEVVPGK